MSCVRLDIILTGDDSLSGDWAVWGQALSVEMTLVLVTELCEARHYLDGGWLSFWWLCCLRTGIIGGDDSRSSYWAVWGQALSWWGDNSFLWLNCVRTGIILVGMTFFPVIELGEARYYLGMGWISFWWLSCVRTGIILTGYESLSGDWAVWERELSWRGMNLFLVTELCEDEHYLDAEDYLSCDRAVWGRALSLREWLFLVTELFEDGNYLDWVDSLSGNWAVWGRALSLRGRLFLVIKLCDDGHYFGWRILPFWWLRSVIL